MKKSCLLLCVLPILLLACNDHTTENKPNPEIKKDSVADNKPVAEPAAPAKRPPIINITDTLSDKMLVLYMKDSAASAERISIKLADILGVKLAPVLKKFNIKTSGKPIAWYSTSKPPYFFEAGIAVDKKPGKLPSNIYSREIGIDSVSIAHFYGSYDLLPQAYEALGDWLKSHNKTVRSKPYEIYIESPVDKDGKPKDPYKVQTDVVFPWK